MTWGVVIKPAEGAPPASPEPKPKLPAWSYSRLSKWEKCPASAFYAFILKVPEPKSDAMERGTLMHEDAAAVLMGNVPKHGLLTPAWVASLHDVHTCYTPDIEVELQLGFTQKWEQTSWFGRDTYCRVIFDAIVMQAGTGSVQVHEHKSGKARAEHTAQASLYAAAAATLAPGRIVEVNINYLDLKPEAGTGIVRHSFSPQFALDQQAKWSARIMPMMADEEYLATPGNHCRWCNFAASKGGPCEKA